MEMGLFYKWFNFLVFLGLLFYFLKEPLKDFLGDRRENIKKDIDEVAKQKARVETKFQDYRKKLAEAHTEINQLQKEMRQEGELEKVNLIKKAKSFAEKIRDDAAKVAEQELGRAKLTLKKMTLLLAVDLAKQWVEKVIENEDQERLISVAIDQLEREQNERKNFS
ncbi:MAG: hypothetical protein A2W61_05310 [Deltaproteobacteria bacterium RIFCSPLOWO2_01_44_7]|nr:MAG: hypothetical protein A2712_01570 [Deltaproteobacteria bacterium RIFCSPHIGHO2_01_FULL_43_49]OGQ15180.1 MAG: hypothetical protein A3D22_03905 [Deltaproteobacteria bacterium RIFCSPHIGHO2_02_FULL_44_53]OGQ27199.1 MAG: hypothetical protein A3D98_02165 [Deltaproteobacteria bacterium RIFCSPHIGHO2_12_FULL_44_21]OGQ31697.1 MAG: hypothetical protein A2979_05065 [Deltaproteobacteria bacterium RIFCSPLOWO2_01_FULL_45_74]OGQ39840.1 MAG: hypothetical protein A2W61_05310 [Deltaproteobacteria bacterium 